MTGQFEHHGGGIKRQDHRAPGQMPRLLPMIERFPQGLSLPTFPFRIAGYDTSFAEFTAKKPASRKPAAKRGRA